MNVEQAIKVEGTGRILCIMFKEERKKSRARKIGEASHL